MPVCVVDHRYLHKRQENDTCHARPTQVPTYLVEHQGGAYIVYLVRWRGGRFATTKKQLIGTFATEQEAEREVRRLSARPEAEDAVPLRLG